MLDKRLLKTNKPMIGITLDYIDDGDKKKYSDFPWYALRRQYADIIYKEGGIPIFLPFESIIDSSRIFEIISGVIIPGGDLDVPPSMYGETIKYDTKPCYERCNYEKEFIRECLEKNMPLLGICHGMQLLNVILGGSLHQNILAQVQGAIDHKQKMVRTHTYHDIDIRRESKLYSILKEAKLPVNSNHRQAVNELGEGLVISATCSEDGVIEAIESINHDFVVGVEWHPEILASDEHDLAIFKAFVDAARNYNV